MGPTLAALPVAPRSPTPHRDTRAAATCVHSSPGLPFRSRGPELRAADASIPRRDAESHQPAGTGGDVSSGEETRARVRAGGPEEPLTSEKFLGFCLGSGRKEKKTSVAAVLKLGTLKIQLLWTRKFPAGFSQSLIFYVISGGSGQWHPSSASVWYLFFWRAESKRMEPWKLPLGCQSLGGKAESCC